MRTPPNPPAVERAREPLAEQVTKITADWPPLDDAKLDHIAALLRAGGAA
jgi:hypothetical protein